MSDTSILQSLHPFVDLVELLQSFLQISIEDGCISQLDDELNQYFKLFSVVISESRTSMSPRALASDEIFLLTLKCLINLCARRDLAKKLFDCINERRRSDLLHSLSSFAFSDANEDSRMFATSLLVNLTVVVEWVQLLCDTPYGDNIYRKITSKCRPNCTELKLLLNMTSSSKIRRRICEERSCLSSLLAHLGELFDDESRLTVAGIFRNCCFEEEYHSHICFMSDDILAAILTRLCDQSDEISDEDRSALPDRVRETYDSKTAKREKHTGVKIALCESLLQLCASETGRSRLRSLGVYFVLREMHRQERYHEENIHFSDQKDELRLQKYLVLVIEQVVEQLICGEDEGLIN